MKHLVKATERKQQFITAQRPTNNFYFPPQGFYFIRGITEKTDHRGNKYIGAAVNWRPVITDEWEDCTDNRFQIDVNFLFGHLCERPECELNDLRHRVIHVHSTYKTYQSLGKKQVAHLVTKWCFSSFRQDDWFDQLPLSSLCNIILEDEAFENEYNNQLVIENDEEEIILESDEEYEFDDESNEPDEDISDELDDINNY